MDEPCRISTLLLVASRVRRWIEPLRYRTIAVTWGGLHDHPRWTAAALARTIRAKPAGFFRHAVHSLLINHCVDTEALTIFSACSGIQNLNITGVSSDALPFQLIGALPLKRLYAHLGGLFGDSPIDFSHPLFSQLTHLEVVDDGPSSASDMGNIPPHMRTSPQDVQIIAGS
ncbi:hypothetical protein FB451DRAFT_1269051 [Mycena latifolia]|nr:hypothetical protein FB451DRAFT_1269051 [Mycena latifolia]